MSGIQECLKEIECFLNAEDQCNTPAMQRVAKAYYDACTEVNSTLAECRNLIESGRFAEAEHLNRKLQPSLIDQSRMLDFSRLEEWQEFCQLYGWPQPPSIDRTAVDRLSSCSFASADLNALVRRWRQIAREGSNAEKLEVLRKLIDADPAGGRVWKENLLGVERSRIAELLHEGRQAVEVGDAVVLQRIYSELISPDWQVAPDPKTLTELAKSLAGFQNNELRAEEKKILDEIAIAYSAMDPDDLAQKLERWQILCTEPEFQPDPVGVRQVEDARSWLQEIQEQQERKRRFSELEKQLSSDLEVGANLQEVECVYNALVELDLPISSHLSERVERYRRECQLLEHRQHVRKCIYGLGLVVLLVIGMITVARMLQNNHEIQEVRSQMEAFLEQRNPSAALMVYEQVQVNSPRLVAQAELLALKAKADQLASELAVTDSEFVTLLEYAEKVLVPGQIEKPEVTKLFEKLEKLVPERSPELQGRYSDVARKRQILLVKNRDRRKQEFLTHAQKIRQNLEQITSEISKDGSSLPKLEQLVRGAEQDFSQLLKSNSGLGDILNQQQELVTLAVARADSALRSAGKLQKLQKDLTDPADFNAYASALRDIPQVAPSLLDENRKHALELLPLWSSMIENLITDDVLASPERLIEYLNAIPASRAQLPFAVDLVRLAPSGLSVENPLATILEKLDTLEREVVSDSDLYELIFLTSNGKEYRFYSITEPKVLYTSKNVAKSMELSVSLHSGCDGLPFYFQLFRPIADAGVSARYRFQPSSQTALEDLTFPREFRELRGVDLNKPVFQKAFHYRFLVRMIAQLRSAKSLTEMERETRNLLQIAFADQEMNPYMKMVVVKRLLGLLRMYSGLYDTRLVDLFLQRLNAGTAKRNWNWRNPCELTSHSEEVQGIKDALDSFKVDRYFAEVDLQRKLFRVALSRKFIVAGIVEKSASGELVVRSLPNSRFRELWSVGTASKDEYRIICLPDSVVEDGRIPGEYAQYCFPGQILLAPAADWKATAELTESFWQEASRLNLSIGYWPQQWPLNRRKRK